MINSISFVINSGHVTCLSEYNKKLKKIADRFTNTITCRRFNVHEYEFDCTNNSRFSITACDYSASYIHV
jgi:hypothetical protein